MNKQTPRGMQLAQLDDGIHKTAVLLIQVSMAVGDALI